MSIATVSRALNDGKGVDPETRSRVLQAAEEIGYRRLAERQLEMASVGLVHTSKSAFCEYDGLLLSGILEALGEFRHDLVWCDIHRDKQESESYSQFFRRKGIRGAILRTFGDSRQVCEAIAAEGFPAIAVGEAFSDPLVSWIRINCVEESRRATAHLAGLGHRRIALVTHVRPTSDHADRERGYRDALSAEGIEFEEDLVIRIRVGIDSGAAAVSRLVAMPNPPTAIFVTDPPTAAGAISQLHQLGLKIPEDMSIIGFDDGTSRLTNWPRLTAVCQDTPRLGFEAARWLGRRLAGLENSALQLELPSVFEVNQTTGSPNPQPKQIFPDGTRVAACAERRQNTDGPAARTAGVN